MESCQYRGYQIETRREWSNWCVSVYRTRSDIPILPQPTFAPFDVAKGRCGGGGQAKH